jgi:eukaryotic-like serine/threonine-protein kinase
MAIDVSAPTGMASTLPFGFAADTGLCPIAWRAGVCFGRYELVEEIGSGAMGVVWAARDMDLDRHVALKLIRSGGRSLPELRGRLLGEARAMARLSHPNVVTVHDVGTTEDGLFIAMEHLDGGTLDQWLDASPRSWREVVDKFIEAGRGLAEAHRAGLVHRDFKPENVLMGRDGVARVADFGLAVPVAESTGATGDSGTGAGERAVTEEGVLVGTLAFMAPEQLLGQRATARSDQFGFSVALYEALYGIRPFGGQSCEIPAAVLLTAIVEGCIAPPPPGRRVPGRLHRLLLRGLACEPEDRWATMDALVAELEECRARALPTWIAAPVAVVAGLAGRVARGANRPPTPTAPPTQPAAMQRVAHPTRRLQVVKPPFRDTAGRAFTTPPGGLGGGSQRCRSAASISAAAAISGGSTSF